MRLELRVPGSPTPSFLNQMLLQAASIRKFHPDTIVRAYFGQEGGFTEDAEARIFTAFAGKKIGFEWVARDKFAEWGGTRSPYLATMNKRWENGTSNDAVIITDADVIFTGPLDELFETHAVQGTQAHVAPLPYVDMHYLYAICSAPWPDRMMPFSGAGIMGSPVTEGPPYPNSGFVYVPKDLFLQMAPHYHDAIWRMKSAMRDTYWFDQLALGISIAASGVPYRPLPLRYNFPNQTEFDARHPEELADVRVLHYLRENLINRTSDFESVSALRKLTQRRDLIASHEVLRQAIMRNMSILEPVGLGNVEDVPWA